MRFILLIGMFVFPLAFAQHTEQPAKESTSDLRHQSLLFKLEDLKKDKAYWVEQTQNMDFFLRARDGKKDSIKKISSQTARKLERDFASRFLRAQYEISEVPGKCEVTLRLNLRGEGQNICQKDDKKTQEIYSFIEEIQKQL